MCKLIFYRDHNTWHWGYVSIDKRSQFKEFIKYFHQCRMDFITLSFSSINERKEFLFNCWGLKNRVYDNEKI